MFEILLSGKSQSTEPVEPTAAAIDNAVFGTAPAPGYGFHFTCVVVGKRLYHFGMYTGSASAVARYFDTTTGTFTTLASMPTATYGAQAVHYNGKIYIIGGTRADNTNNVIIYDIAANTYSRGTTVLPAVSFFGIAQRDNHAYIANADNTGNLYVYDVVTDTFSTIALGVAVQICASGSIVGDYLYVFGGRSTSLVHRTTAFRVHLDTHVVEQLTPLPKPLMIAWNRFIFGKYIVFVGAFDASSVSSTTHGFFYYNTETGTYTVLTTIANIRGYGWNGFVTNIFYVLGGINSSTGKSDAIKLTLAV